MAGHAVGDAGGKARLALTAEAVDQNTRTFPITKGAQNALRFAAPADKLGRGGDRHAPLPEVEKFLVAGIPAKDAARAP